MAILVAVVWDKCIIAANINIGGLVAGSLISFVVLGYSYVNATMEVRRYSLLYGILIFIFGTLATCIWKKKVTSHRCLIMLLVLVVVSSMIDGHITNNQRSIVYRSNDTLEFRNGELANNTAKALKYIESIDDSFYRVEKTYADWVGIGDALIEGYSAVTCYNSTLNRNLADYYNILYENSNIDQSIKVFTIKNASDVQAISLVNVKYILSKEKLDYEWCKLIGQEGDVLIYRNMNTESIAKWFTNTISKEEYVGLTEEEKETVLYNKLIVENADEIHYIGNKDYRLSDFKLVNQNTVLGKINSSSEGMLLLSIPDQQGWNIYVDGELVKTYNADYGLIGVKLEAGEHEIIARYTIPYWKEGAIVSIVGVLFLILMVVFPGIKRVIIKNKDKYKGEQL